MSHAVFIETQRRRQHSQAQSHQRNLSHHWWKSPPLRPERLPGKGNIRQVGERADVDDPLRGRLGDQLPLVPVIAFQQRVQQRGEVLMLAAQRVPGMGREQDDVDLTADGFANLLDLQDSGIRNCVMRRASPSNSI